MSTLSELSNDLAQIVKDTDASIIRIEGRRRLPATGVAWSKDGYIVTSHHVVERNEDITVGLPDGETVSAELVGRDPSTDLAVLKADASLTPPQWGAIDELEVGNIVLALGRPAENVLASLGVVSALEDHLPQIRFGNHGASERKRGRHRGRRGGRQGHHPFRLNLEYYLQTDVVMYPGFSGGPLVGAGGKVYGLNTSALVRGISMAITVPTLERVVPALTEHGRIPRGFLGVGVQTVELPSAIAEESEQTHGVLVVSVEPDSPAESAGIVLGDTIISLDGESVETVDDLLNLLAGGRVGMEVAIQILRAGSLQELNATVGERS